MRKGRFIVYLILNALVGILVARMLLSETFSTFPVTILMVATSSLLLFYNKLVKWVIADGAGKGIPMRGSAPMRPTGQTVEAGDTGQDNAPPKFIRVPVASANVRGTPMEIAYLSILDYTSRNKSTPFFKSKLETILLSMDAFQNKYQGLDALLKDKFVEGAKSYEKFKAPVNQVREKLVENSLALVHNLQHFDEVAYADRIESLRADGDEEAAYRYETIELEYKTEVNNLVNKFDESNLRLDRLILEIGRLGGLESESNLAEIDNLIEDIKLCR